MKDKWLEQAVYLGKHEPIGCSDSETLDFLQQNNVTAFMSGLMLLLKNPSQHEVLRQGIYTTDVSVDVFKLLPAEIQKVARDQNAIITDLSSHDSIERFRGIYRVIEEYRGAELVVTQCLHCALACVALGTPVIFIDTADTASRAAKMTSLFHTLDLHNRSESQAREWLAKFAWHEVPPNPDVAKMMRLRATAWNVIRQNQALYDAAKKFGTFPMSPPQILPNDQKILFHMIFTSSNKSVVSTLGSETKQSGAFNWRHWRSVESVFRQHPTARLIVHSNTLSQSIFNVLTEAGYNVEVGRYDLKGLLTGSPAESFIPRLAKARKGQYWVYNEANLLRLLLLYLDGGMYMDTDIILVRPLDALVSNAIGYQDSSNRALNNAILWFDKGHPFLALCLQEFVKHYNGDIWSYNGPRRISAAKGIWMNSHNHPPIYTWRSDVFYMIHYNDIKTQCFEITSGDIFDKNMKDLHTKAYGVHINAKVTGYIGVGKHNLKEGTLCSYLLNEYCVLCDHRF